MSTRNTRHKKIMKFAVCVKLCQHTLMPVYQCHKPGFRLKMAIFRKAGMREGGLPLPLAFQYLILLI